MGAPTTTEQLGIDRAPPVVLHADPDVDQVLLGIYCREADCTPAEAQNAISTMREAVAGMHNCLLAAKTCIMLAHEAVEDARRAKYVVNDIGTPTREVHPLYYDYKEAEGKVRRMEFNRSQERLVTLLREVRQHFEKATWFSTVAANERLLSAQAAEVRDADDVDEDLHQRIDEAVSLPEHKGTRTQKLRKTKRMRKELEAGYAAVLDEAKDIVPE